MYPHPYPYLYLSAVWHSKWQVIVMLAHRRRWMCHDMAGNWIALGARGLRSLRRLRWPWHGYHRMACSWAKCVTMWRNYRPDPQKSQTARPPETEKPRTSEREPQNPSPAGCQGNRLSPLNSVNKLTTNMLMPKLKDSGDSRKKNKNKRKRTQNRLHFVNFCINDARMG